MNFKSFVVSLMLLFLIVGFGLNEQASAEKNNFINFSSLSLRDVSVGIGQRITQNAWFAINFDNLSGQDFLRVSVSAIYEVPKRFLIFRLYGGAGVHFEIESAIGGVHLALGSEFLWFFTEGEYDLLTNEAHIRTGYRLRF